MVLVELAPAPAKAAPASETVAATEAATDSALIVDSVVAWIEMLPAEVMPELVLNASMWLAIELLAIAAPTERDAPAPGVTAMATDPATALACSWEVSDAVNETLPAVLVVSDEVF